MGVRRKKQIRNEEDKEWKPGNFLKTRVFKKDQQTDVFFNIRYFIECFLSFNSWAFRNNTMITYYSTFASKVVNFKGWTL